MVSLLAVRIGLANVVGYFPSETLPHIRSSDCSNWRASALCLDRMRVTPTSIEVREAVPLDAEDACYWIYHHS